MPAPTQQSAAVAVLLRGDLVLTVCDPVTNLLCLPGGKVEPGETAEQGAARELKEETGLTATSIRYLGRFPSSSRFVAMFWVPTYEGALEASPEGYPIWVLPSEILERPRGPHFAASALWALSAVWRLQGRQDATVVPAVERLGR